MVLFLFFSFIERDSEQHLKSAAQTTSETVLFALGKE